MQAIAEETDALFQIVSDLDGENRYALEAFYFKAFSIAKGRHLALDPLIMVTPQATPQLIATVNIVTCDRNADFLVLSELFKYPALQTKLILEDPTGQLIDPGATIGGIAVHIKSGGHFKLYRIKFPDKSNAHTYIGQWKLYLLPVGAVESDLKLMAAMHNYSGNFPVSLLASVGSDYRLHAHLTAGEVLVGQPLHISALTSEAWWPNPDATVSARITRPNGSIVNVTLHDDGAHNDAEAQDATFGLDFTQTSLKGYYDILVTSLVTTTRGEVVRREVKLSKYIGPYLPDDQTERPCLPCWLMRLIIIFIILLLLAILVILIICCRTKLRSTTAIRQ